MTHRIGSALLIACALAPACSEEPVPIGADDLVGYTLVADIAPDPTTKLDILFVVDNSNSMAEEQLSLTEWAGASLFDVLELETDVVPDLHIGVISTDMGAGYYDIAACLAAGDAGELLDTPRVEGCTPPTDRYIIDEIGPGGERVRNYTGTIAETFACIAPLGAQGCGFEQPLEAARRALGDLPANAGFLRDDALLAIVILSDEDDCSASDPGVFDPAGDEAVLGPISSFRCFEHGVVCAEPDPRVPGARTECHSREDSAYLTPVATYADFFRALKADPSMVVVAGIFGDPDLVEVAVDGVGHPLLQPSCSSVNGTAAPGVRLHELLAAFPGRSSFSSICAPTMSSSLTDTAHIIAGTATQSPCLLGAVADQSSIETGLQPDCRVLSVARYGTAAERRTEVPACGSGDATCFTLEPDAPQCSHTATGLAVAMTGEPAAGSHLLVACRTE